MTCTCGIAIVINYQLYDCLHKSSRGIVNIVIFTHSGKEYLYRSVDRNISKMAASTARMMSVPDDEMEALVQAYLQVSERWQDRTG